MTNKELMESLQTQLDADKRFSKAEVNLEPGTTIVSCQFTLEGFFEAEGPYHIWIDTTEEGKEVYNVLSDSTFEGSDLLQVMRYDSISDVINGMYGHFIMTGIVVTISCISKGKISMSDESIKVNFSFNGKEYLFELENGFSVKGDMTLIVYTFFNREGKKWHKVESTQGYGITKDNISDFIQRMLMLPIYLEELEKIA